MIRELWEVMRDALECGDWAGHLRAWWAVAIGRVQAQDARWWPAK